MGSLRSFTVRKGLEIGAKVFRELGTGCDDKILWLKNDTGTVRSSKLQGQVV